MPLVYNALDKDFQGKALGSFHSIPAKKYKIFTDKLAHWLVTMRKESGLVGLSEAFEDPSFASTEEGKAELLAATKQGVDNRVAHLNKLAYNEQVSLKRDLDMANVKVDPNFYASDSILETYKELASYRKSADDSAEQRAKQIAELQKTIKGS